MTGHQRELATVKKTVNENTAPNYAPQSVPPTKAANETKQTPWPLQCVVERKVSDKPKKY